MVDAGMTASEAYVAVPQLKARGPKCQQNLRKRAKAERAKQEPAAVTPTTKPAAKPAAKPEKQKAHLPKGKRLRSGYLRSARSHLVPPPTAPGCLCSHHHPRRVHSKRIKYCDHRCERNRALV
jgi:hypothetical protein